MSNMERMLKLFKEGLGSDPIPEELLLLMEDAFRAGWKASEHILHQQIERLVARQGRTGL